MDNNVLAEILKISHLLRRQVGCQEPNFHERIGITGIRMVRFLAQNKDRDVFQKDLEEEFSLRASSVSVTLKKMESKGFIRREPVDYDARLKRIVLTDKVYKIHEEKSRQYDSLEKKISENMTKEEMKQLELLLRKLADALE